MPVSDVIDVVIAEVAADMKACPLATLKEGRVTTVAASAILRAGYALVEAYPSTGKGMKFWMEAESLKWCDCPLTQRAGLDGRHDKPDLRVFDPQIHLEFKTLPRIGAKALATVALLNADVEKVRSKTADAFVLAADDKMYDQSRGAKRDNRGRPRESVALLDRILPALSDLPADRLMHHACADDRFRAVVKRVTTPFGFDRVAAAVLLK